MAAEVWPIDIAPIGHVAVGTTAWRRAGALWVTVVAKATFAFAPGGVMPLAEPQEVRRAEKHAGDNPVRSVRASSDLCPYLELADVLFIGHACAPRGEPASAVKVRLAIVRGSWFLLDKELEVFGDRAGGTGEPKPFQRMPLVYERAYGGLGFTENPLGIETPNIVYADPARRQAPAGLAPISWYWPSRKRALKAYARAVLERQIAEVPEETDAESFQAAPEDQRVPFLRGEELIMLEGVNPAHPQLMMRLPAMRGLARVFTSESGTPPIPLNADTLLIDGDVERCSITFRGCFSAPSEEALAGVCVGAGVEIGGSPIEWPEELLRRRAAERRRSALGSAAAPSQKPAAGWNERTVELRSGQGMRAMATLPFINRGEAPSGPVSPLEGTLTMSGEDTQPPPLSAPFKIMESGAPVRAAAPIPGAPWTSSGTQAAPTYAGPVEQTLSVGEETLSPEIDAVRAPEPPPPLPSIPPPPPSVPAAIAPPAPAEAAKPAEPPPLPPSPPPPSQKAPEQEARPQEKPAWSWATPAPTPAASPAKPSAAAAKPPPAPAVKSKLYGAFGPNKK